MINGKELSEKIKSQLLKEVELLKSNGRTPGLAVILVGEDPASQVYVKNKILSCEKLGIVSFHHKLSAEVSEQELLSLINTLNNDSSVDGILVQLPLPKHLNEDKILLSIDPNKDVDGLHPVSMGYLLTGRSGFLPCTPHGVMKMFEEIHLDLSGKRAVVIGRSNIVGKPIGLLMLAANATVTFCHSRTQNLPDRIREADIVVAAVGIPEFVKGEWIKEGAVVIDVGINRKDDNKLVGDVEFATASQKAAFITPVPGGVGPMTIAMLMFNTVESAKKRH